MSGTFSDFDGEVVITTELSEREGDRSYANSNKKNKNNRVGFNMKNVISEDDEGKDLQLSAESSQEKLELPRQSKSPRKNELSLKLKPAGNIPL